MATLLGSATLNTAFTSSIDSTVVTNDLNRVTTTEYRKPVAVHSSTSPADFRPLYINDVNLYLQGGYVQDDYLEFNDYYETIETATSPNNPGSSTLFCNFNFLEVDPVATITSVEVRMTLKSSIGGYSSFAPYGTQDELHYGKVKIGWADQGSGDTNIEETTTKVTTNDLTTLSFTLTPDGVGGSFWDSTGLGDKHMVKLTFEGVVRPPAEGGAFPGQQSLSMQIFAFEARVNYTGRTRFVTGFKSPSTISGGTGTTPLSSTGYGFAIPSDHILDGVAVRFGADRAGSGNAGHGNFLNQSSVANNMHFQSGGSQVSTSTMVLDPDTLLMGAPTLYDDGTSGRTATLYQSVDEDNTDAEITTAEANASDFGILTKFLPVSGSVGFDLEPSTLDINIAHVGPIISGNVPINTVSTLTATPVMTHGNTADEIDDFTTAVSLSALGGLLLQAEANPSTAITTTVGTAGRIRTGFTVSMPAAFTVPDITVEFAITAASFIFPSASVTVSAAVEKTTPATSTSAFTTTPGTTIGMIRAGFDIAVPSAFTTPAISDVLLVKAPNDKQIYVTPVDTRTHIIPEDARTLALETETRTYIIPEDDRIHELETETRTTTPEALQ